MRMKRIIIVFLLCILAIFIATSVKLEIVINDNNSINKKIDTLTKETNNIGDENTKYEKDIEELKEVNKEKWEELEIWKKTEEKITKALS